MALQSRLAATRAERLAILGFGISLLLLVIVGTALYLAAERARVTGVLGDRSLGVLDTLARLDADVSRSQSAQRGAELYRDERFLLQRDDALAKAQADAHRLVEISESAGIDRRRVADLEGVVQRRSTNMRKGYEEWRLHGTFPSNDPDAHRSSKQIHQAVRELREAQVRKVRDSRDQEESNFRFVYLLLAASAAILCALILPVYVGFVRQSRSRQATENRMRELAESLPGAVFQSRTWPDGRMSYEFVSSHTLEVRGVTPEAALRDADALLDTIVDVDRKALRSSIEWASKNMTPVSVDFRVKHPKTGTRWIRATSAPSAQRDGSVRWSGHWQDITTQKELEAGLLRAMEEAGAANEAKSRFLATMSHEIRTPMNGVLAMLELLSLTELDAEQSASLAIVRESGRSLLRIIDDILDFSKIEAGKMDVLPEPASIERLVERVVNVYSGIASKKGLALTRFVDPDISPALMFDPTRLQQVLGNLVSNAIKFTQAGEVAISARIVARRPGEDLVRLEVRDSGIGMTLAEQDKVFEAFAQVSTESTSRFGGTGLGLPISRHLTKLMNGTIEMRSRPGEGTAVRVTIPLPVADPRALAPMSASAAPAAAIARRRPPALEAAARANQLVLVVDDHPINRTVLLKQVNALGYAAEVAGSGSEALEKWMSGRFSILLLDCNMPEVSGYDVARALRRREAEEGVARTAIIACTANAMMGESERCRDAGMDDYLVKPIALVDLSEKLRQWIREGPLEPSALEEIAGDDAEMKREVLERFRRYNEDDTRSLRDAVRRRSAEEVVNASHRIKGASRTIGATALAAACEAIEISAREAHWGGIEAGMERFERELALLETYIGSRVETP